ncbi:hypothetical protein [Empedobacter brevis]|uniref:hypothetical protein n=1 Tax=Empedobacter brevis TaxID=247 RepID=UPI0028B11961|nr:hypothetical protein [Empedobacter brevis]
MIKQNPFSFYDFLGYFIPGAITLLLIFLLNNLDEIIDFNSLLSVITKNEEFQIDKFVIIVIVSYSLGHLINYLSSFTIEKYANWRYDYPSKYLLKIGHDYKYFRFDNKIKNPNFRFYLALVIFPVFIWDEKLKLKVFYTKELDSLLINVIKQKSLILLNKLQVGNIKSFDDINENDFHRILSHYVYENSKNHSSKLSNYVALYGFLRCMCLISVISFWLYVYYLIINICSYFNKFDTISFYDISIFKFIILIGISCVCYIYFMAFIKFYRRYTLETYMIIAIDKDLVKEV